MVNIFNSSVTLDLQCKMNCEMNLVCLEGTLEDPLKVLSI